ncbi:MAG: LysM peptidoglycan-binding domain-containing protein [Flavobacterium sp.]|nr:LysM peptidoglycan-binding domain-containing protein [Flavobacterium sp.]
MAELKKIVIKAKDGNGEKFTALVNPTKYSLSYKNEYIDKSPPGSAESNLQFVKVTSPAFDLEFLLDGTGVTEGARGNALVNKIIGKASKRTTVAEQFDQFLKTTGKYDGQIHKPYELEIEWGVLKFEGVMLEFSVDFTLFSPEGYPLRGIIKAKFQGSTDIDLAAAKANKRSPDLTHKRLVKDGDTLTQMTKNIYGDSKYYLEVAKANGLINFRQLIPGSLIYFPPLDKKAQ